MDVLLLLLPPVAAVIGWVVAKLKVPKNFAFSFHELILTYAYVAGGLGVLSALHGGALLTKTGLGYAFDPGLVYGLEEKNGILSLIRPPTTRQEDLGLGIGLLLVGTLAYFLHRRLRDAWIRADTAQDRFLDESYLVFQLCFTAGVAGVALVSFIRDSVAFALMVTKQGPLATLPEFAFFAPAWILYLRAVLIRRSLPKPASRTHRAAEVAATVQPNAGSATSEQLDPTTS